MTDQWGTPDTPPAAPSAPWGAPPPPGRSTSPALIVGLVLAGLLLVVIVPIGAIALLGNSSASSKFSVVGSAIGAEPLPTIGEPLEDEEGRFVDPQGTYSLSVPDDWIATSGGVAAEIEAWAVAEAQDGFAPNVNVLTQNAPGVDLQDYLDLSVENASKVVADFSLIDASTIEGPSGPLGRFEYTATVGENPLHFLAAVAVESDTAIVATFTAPEARFQELVASIEPSLFTLRTR